MFVKYIASKIVTRIWSEIMELETNEKPMWASKKVWVSFAAALIGLLNTALGWDIPVEQMSMIIGPMIAYVIGQGMADLGKNQ